MVLDARRRRKFPHFQGNSLDHTPPVIRDTAFRLRIMPPPPPTSTLSDGALRKERAAGAEVSAHSDPRRRK